MHTTRLVTMAGSSSVVQLRLVDQLMACEETMYPAGDKRSTEQIVSDFNTVLEFMHGEPMASTCALRIELVEFTPPGGGNLATLEVLETLADAKDCVETDAVTHDFALSPIAHARICATVSKYQTV